MTSSPTIEGNRIYVRVALQPVASSSSSIVTYELNRSGLYMYADPDSVTDKDGNKLNITVPTIPSQLDVSIAISNNSKK